jgi:hypothetical protein
MSDAEYAQAAGLHLINTSGYVTTLGDSEISDLWEDYAMYMSEDDENNGIATLGRLWERLTDLVVQDLEDLQ